MKNKIVCISLAITFFALSAFAAPSKMQVTLSISPSTTLPGLSVPLDLRVRNGAGALHIAPSVRVRATSPDGQTFFADWGEGVDSGELELGVTDETDRTFTLPANATVDLSVPALDLSRPSWALDSRLLAQPGEWTLQVVLYTEDLSEPAATSNAVKLTIATPTGTDVPVWQAIQRREYWGIADKVLAEQPQSPYFPYLAAIVARRATLEKIAIIERAIALHPESPAVPSLRYALASYYGMEADRVFLAERDFDRAVALAEKGRGELARMKNGKDAWAKLKGNAKLGEFPSREYFVTLRRLQQEQGAKRE
jgi:hypothetical protein